MLRTVIFFSTFIFVTMPIKAGNTFEEEGRDRMNHIVELYNKDENDSLILQAALDLQFHKDHELWDNYYETWMHIVNTYVFSGQVNTGLKEVKQMHQDATQRRNKYGIALANYAMGNAYINMGYSDEALDCYKQSLRMFDDDHKDATTLNDLYSYYCDALNTLKKYEEMELVANQWKSHLDYMQKNKKYGSKGGSDIWNAYYHLACAQYDMGLKRFDSARQHIDEADRLANAGGIYLISSSIYYRAQLYLLQKEYQKALEYNDMQLEKSKTLDDKSSLLLIWQQRSDILAGLGRYEEALGMSKDIIQLTDTIYRKDARTQINELNALFHVNEIDMERKLEHSKFVIFSFLFLAVVLAVMVGYWHWMNRRLKQKNQELSIARDQAQESSRMKSDFIKNISHEIRTPLNVLSGFAQIMAQPDADLTEEVRQEASEKIQENTGRITTLVNQLLSLSESGSRHHIERTDNITAGQLCLNAIAKCGIADSPHHHFEFDNNVDDNLTLRTSEYYAVMALCPLLDNAQKFTPEGGSIRMLCSQEDQHLVIAIEDTGCGIPPEKAEEIFSEFVQLNEYKEGIGVGLTLARTIVRQLGGEISLDTSYTNGARFIFALPINN